jgi:hypothetical protein
MCLVKKEQESPELCRHRDSANPLFYKRVVAGLGYTADIRNLTSVQHLTGHGIADLTPLCDRLAITSVQDDFDWTSDNDFG